jgi:hypothetical protein
VSDPATSTLSKSEKRRLDILLRRALPHSYNTFPRRYDRAVDDLLHVRNSIPGDDRDGKLTFTETTAREWLAIRASGLQPTGMSHVKFLTDAHAAARSDAARQAEAKGRPSRRRVSDGKFAAKITGLLDEIS